MDESNLELDDLSRFIDGSMRLNGDEEEFLRRVYGEFGRDGLCLLADVSGDDRIFLAEMTQNVLDVHYGVRKNNHVAYSWRYFMLAQWRRQGTISASSATELTMILKDYLDPEFPLENGS